MKTKTPPPEATKTVYPILRQIVNLIPPNIFYRKFDFSNLEDLVVRLVSLSDFLIFDGHPPVRLLLSGLLGKRNKCQDCRDEERGERRADGEESAKW